MARQVQSRRPGSYGMDAPYAFAFITTLGVAVLILAILNAVENRKLWQLVPALFIATLAAKMLHTTLRGKFAVWAEILQQLGLRGDEQILDGPDVGGGLPVGHGEDAAHRLAPPAAFGLG